MGLEEFCCVCVEKGSQLENINETNGKYLNYQHKLSICVPNRKWEKDFNICKNCIEKLESAYDFIQTCLLSEELRKEQLLLLTEQNDSNKEIDTIEFLYECEECKEQFESEQFLKLHSRIHKRQFIKERFEADLKLEQPVVRVDEYFENLSDNENYIFEKELVPLIETKKINEWKSRSTCEYCGKIFSRAHYPIHVRIKHTFDNPYQCKICNAKFPNSNRLLIHKRKHNNERPYICSYCGKSFDCIGSLYHHNKIHLNKREYKCNLCEKRFNTTSCLRTHQKCMHTGPEKWKYVCNYCSKRFPLSSRLERHLKRHIGIKECSCHICEKNFFDKAELKSHLRSHSCDRLFKCNICHKDYKKPNSLRHHMKVIHDLASSNLSSQ